MSHPTVNARRRNRILLHTTILVLVALSFYGGFILMGVLKS